MAGPADWDERYGTIVTDYAYGTEPNGFLKETVPKLELRSCATVDNKKQQPRCLMLADGEGRNGVYMAKQGMNVVSVDYSQAGLDKAQQLATSQSVTIETVLADLNEYDFGIEQWDCIVSIYCHLPAPIRTKVLQLIPKALKPGGYFLLECYTPEQLQYKTGGPPVAEMMYSKEILSEAFGETLQVEHNEELVRDVVEGKFHTGKGAVVQFIGRKPK